MGLVCTHNESSDATPEDGRTGLLGLCKRVVIIGITSHLVPTHHRLGHNTTGSCVSWVAHYPESTSPGSSDGQSTSPGFNNRESPTTGSDNRDDRDDADFSGGYAPVDCARPGSCGHRVPPYTTNPSGTGGSHMEGGVR